MDEQFESSNQEAIQSSLSIGISNFNGVLCLAGALARQGLLQQSDIDYMHSSMLAPLSNDNVNEKLMAHQSQRIDDLMALLVKSIQRPAD